ncbi:MULTISPECIES: hypothetical protein [unclassified Pseudovibrio]|uniref:hypothetical protein n=1 Tax=unclassified Pseudovibrio TaxID=2627060 RepID=UPI0007AE90FF|nr:MULTISPECIES: hypothetical protein [unclassified Pseudovibrio]KZL01490.1 hypothetical protein PsW74_01827 [Pseudovibrio sp. W74]KZL05811.1 hypothetical protein PsAD14_04705 [Pseudovibrio sp. Ad14]
MRREREVAIYDLKGELWLELSFTPDSDARSDFETDLWHALEFHTQTAVPYRFITEKEINFAFEYKPNADLGGCDLGDEAASTWCRSDYEGKAYI